MLIRSKHIRLLINKKDKSVIMSLLVKKCFKVQSSAKNNKRKQIQLTVYYQETFLAEGRALNILLINEQRYQDFEP